MEKATVKMRCEAEEGTMVFVGYHQRMVALKKMLLVFLLLDWFFVWFWLSFFGLLLLIS